MRWYIKAIVLSIIGWEIIDKMFPSLHLWIKLAVAGIIIGYAERKWR